MRDFDFEDVKEFVGECLESADMWYQYTGISIKDGSKKPIYFPMVIRDCESDEDIPAWSLSALLEVLPTFTIDSSDDHYFIFVAEVPPKKKYSESLYNMLREQGFNIKVEGKQKDDRQEFTVSDKAVGYMSESDLATLSNAQEKDVILLFVKMK